MAEAPDGNAARWGDSGPFTVVPWWIIDAKVSDRAIRLYCVLQTWTPAVRSGDRRAHVSRRQLADSLGCAVSTLDNAVKELRDLGAITVEKQTTQRGDLTWSEYVINASPPPASRTGYTDQPGEGYTDQSVNRERVRTTTEVESPIGDSPVPTPTDRPPEIVKVNGRNLPWDTIVAVCKMDPRSPRTKQIPTALNGRIHKRTGEILEEGITHLFWRECMDFIDAAAPVDRTDLIERASDPAHYAESLAKAIERRAALYRAEFPKLTLSPLSLRNWWLDVKQSTTSAGSLADDIRSGRV